MGAAGIIASIFSRPLLKMPELALLGHTGAVTMNDIMVTLGAIIAAMVAWRQRSKDEQIKERDKHIEWLQTQLDKQREEEENLRQKLRDK